MDTLKRELKFRDATEQAKGILDLIEVHGSRGDCLLDGSLWRAAQAARQSVERAEKHYAKLERAYRRL